MKIEYLPNTDTYYFPNKEIYIKRYMFLYGDSSYVAEMLGLEDMDTKERDRLFLRLAQIPEN